MSDLLDDLLDRSAPATGRTPAAADVRAMVAEARAQARPPRHRRRTAALSGALTLLLVAGAGAATASSVWDWGQGMGDPDRSYTYTSPGWGECELRFGDFTAFSVFDQADVERIVDEWFARTDIEAAAAPLVPAYLAQLERDQADDPQALTDPRTPDLNAWTAHEQAVTELLHRELLAHGYDGSLGAGVSGSASQLHCENEQWG